MDCIDILKEGVGRDLSEKELVELMEKAKIERRRVAAGNEPQVGALLEAALKEHAWRIRTEELAKKRAAMLNFARETENMDFILNAFGDRPHDGLDALVSGSSFARSGARDSVEARQNSLAAVYTGGFMADIEALGHTKVLNSGALDQDIARALWELDDPHADPFTGPPEALTIARVMRAWQNRARSEANAAGAFIGKLDNYVVSQSHSQSAIRKAGFAAWRDAILPGLDKARTFDPDGPARKQVSAALADKIQRQGELEVTLKSLRDDLRAKVAGVREEVAVFIKNREEALRKGVVKGKKGKALREKVKAEFREIRADKRAAVKKLAQEYKGWIQDARAEFREVRGSVAELKKAERSFADPSTDVNSYLQHVWQGLSSGEHLKYGQGPLSQSGRGVGRGMGAGSTAKKLSHERSLHFKDADSWLRYNEKFGMGNVREAFVHGMEKQARGTALMQVLGPSASLNYERLLHNLKGHYMETGQQVQLDALRGKEGTLRNRLKEVDGSLNISADDTLAAAGVALRGIEAMAKLGSVLFSSFTDIPVFGTEFAYQGYGFFKPMSEGMKQLVAGRSSAEKMAILSELGIAQESMLGALAGKHAGDELPGRMSNALRTYFKLNGLTWWTDAWRTAAGLMMSHGLAARRAMGWDELAPELSRVLNMYGIDPEKWDIIRAMDVKRADGKSFVTPEGLRALPRDMFEAYLTARGLKPTEHRVRGLREEIAAQLRTYFRDRVDYAVLQPDSKTRTTLRQGASAGTVPGEALRFFAQFKAFPTGMIQKVWGREAFGRGANPAPSHTFRGDIRAFGQAMAAGNGEWRGMARLFLMTTLFGYGAMSAKQLMAGREPRDPRDPKTWMAAALQGGALGVYGDFLFGEMRRSRGGGLAATVAGPVWSSAEQIADIAGRMKEGDSFSSASLRVLLNHIPGNNLFYIRPVFDHAIGYELFEMLSPGYIRRTIDRAKKENGQKFWLRPGKASLL